MVVPPLVSPSYAVPTLSWHLVLDIEILLLCVCLSHKTKILPGRNYILFLFNLDASHSTCFILITKYLFLKLSMPSKGKCMHWVGGDMEGEGAMATYMFLWLLWFCGCPSALALLNQLEGVGEQK